MKIFTISFSFKKGKNLSDYVIVFYSTANYFKWNINVTFLMILPVFTDALLKVWEDCSVVEFLIMPALIFPNLQNLVYRFEAYVWRLYFFQNLFFKLLGKLSICRIAIGSKLKEGYQIFKWCVCQSQQIWIFVLEEQILQQITVYISSFLNLSN